MRGPQITYKRRSVDDRRRDLIDRLNALDVESRAYKADLRAISSNSGARQEFRTVYEFNQYVGKLKHNLYMLKVERELIRNQLGRVNRIIKNRNCELRNNRKSF